MIIDGHSVYIRPGFVPQKSWAVFLDRDGVINEERGFVYKIEDFALIPHIIPVLRKFNQANIPVIVVHNAAVVARGMCGTEQVEAFNQHLVKELSASGVFIDAIFYCPHHFDAYDKNFCKDCDWRKPKSGMLRAAITQFHLDPSRSYLIGDHERDILAAQTAGVAAFFIKSGEDILAVADRII
jgi:D-glycero-D-manno-heptose 1,7-bisphosphate phosphatase